MKRLTLAFLVLALGGCPDPEESSSASDAPTLSAYLECEECITGELDAVVALGERAVPALTETLLRGVPAPLRAELEGELSKRHAARAEYGARNPGLAPEWSRREYVEHHLRTRDAQYRVRAAIALGRIGTPRAVAALEEATRRAQTPGVERAIEHALGRD